ncbi:unnamed protein product [Trifolium pratense]|uniref:Uncharacterized protein n=1 Tax=Trifolium pratense TaxID=57577 RepID=A0ACB0LNN0_TRIPR|nr:unnamed protein product [Trifolium pratense]
MFRFVGFFTNNFISQQQHHRRLNFHLFSLTQNNNISSPLVPPGHHLLPPNTIAVKPSSNISSPANTSPYQTHPPLFSHRWPSFPSSPHHFLKSHFFLRRVQLLRFSRRRQWSLTPSYPSRTILPLSRRRIFIRSLVFVAIANVSHSIDLFFKIWGNQIVFMG